MVYYSKEFNKLIEDRERTKYLIKGSGLKNRNFEKWERKRRFIAQAINKDGSILDIGCANGFLLKCLQEWSGRKLIPYGIDLNQRRIKQAKELFPLQADNFIVKDVKKVQNLLDLTEYKFPPKFDFIYWNIWDPWKFENQEEVSFLKTFLKAVSDGGRLILGFYESDQEKNKKIKKLKELGFKFSGTLENRSGKEIIIYIDKSNI